MGCKGLYNNNEHCCWVAGKECMFLQRNKENKKKGRYFSCGLRDTLGSWEAVHESPEYIEHVKPAWNESGTSDCGDYPRTSEFCNLCGANVNG